MSEWKYYIIDGCEVRLDGCEIRSITDGKIDESKWLLKESDLKIGMEIAVPYMFGYYKMKVNKNSFGKMFAENKELYADLYLSKDERKCWISTHLINKSSQREIL